ncbi:hypothetical protein [Microbacterium cremeum]|uniref:hypothetical protein n=1 Tax=Microbacterium cremeum TaxID=2782169 RepID=UPI0018891876|nr:hypothetical protein [Microbacterium cremeum]
MILRATGAAALVAVSIIALAGCFGSTPEPTPTPTAVFSSEEEAFAAAEETYRAYIDAVNARRTDPQSEPDPLAFLSGSAFESELAAQRDLDAAGLRPVGDGVVDRVDHLAAQPRTGEVELRVCINAAEVRVLDREGEDVTSPERADLTLLHVYLVPAGESLTIERSEVAEIGEC